MLNKKVVNLDINGKEYIGCLDMKALIHYKKEHKASLLQDMTALQKGIDEVLILQVLGSVIRPSEKSQPVGIKFFENFDILTTITELTPLLTELMTNENVPMENAQGKN